MSESNYEKYRGRCLELSKAACEADPTLRLVRGYYFCPLWNVEKQHWWCERQDGTIYDPSRLQYPSAGHGEYREFDGTCECTECGKMMREEDAITEGRFAFCSLACYGRFVGMYDL